MHSYNRIPFFATSVGCLLLAASAGMNVNAALDGGQPLLSPTVFGIVALVIGQATAVRCGQHAWRHKLRGRAMLAFFALGCAELYGLYTGAERLLIARENRAQTVAAENRSFDVSVRRVKLAEVGYANAEAAAVDEARRGGCRRVCRDLRAAAERARDELEQARASFEKAPPEKSESVVADVTGWPPAAVEIAPALMYTVALNLLAFSLLAIGEGAATDRLPHQATKGAVAKSRKPPSRRSARRVQRRVSPNSATPSSAGSRTEQVAEFCREFRAQFGREPSFGEVRNGTQFAKSTVSTALARVRGS